MALDLETLCAGCKAADESWLHMLRDCPCARDVWMELKVDKDFFTSDVTTWIKSRATNCNQSTFPGLNSNTIFLAGTWSIWKSRNKLIFDGVRAIAKTTARYALSHATEIQTALSILPHQSSATQFHPQLWIPPPRDAYKLSTDGSMTEFTAAAGGIIRDHLES